MPGTKPSQTEPPATVAPGELADSHESETDFERLSERALSRRGFVAGGVAFGTAAFVTSAAALRPLSALANNDRFGFEPVAANTLDTVTVPKGYRWHVVARWGDPMWSDGAEFDQRTRGHRREPGARLRRQQTTGCPLFADGGTERACRQQRIRETARSSTPPASRRPPTTSERAKAGHGVLGRRDRESATATWVDRPRTRPITGGSPPTPPMEITGPAARPQPAQGPPPIRRPCKSLGHLETDCGKRAYPLGHLSCLRGELQRLFLVQRSGAEDRSGLQALRHRAQGLGLCLGERRRAVRYREATQRAQPRRLHRRDRPPRSRIDTEEADRPSAASSTRTRKSFSPPTDRWWSIWETTSVASSCTGSSATAAMSRAVITPTCSKPGACSPRNSLMADAENGWSSPRKPPGWPRPRRSASTPAWRPQR